MIDRTQQCIFDAFNRLASKADIEKISVNMIVEEARVSRATFYRYYKDKYEVMNQNHKIMMEKCIAVSHNYEELFYHLFLYGKEHLKTINRIFSSVGVNSFSNFLASESARIAEEITIKNRGSRFTPEESMQVDLICHGISYISEKWIKNSYDLSAKEAAHAVYMLLPIQLRDYWY